MAIAEAHASVTSPIGHGGFDFVLKLIQTNAYIKVETLQFILYFSRSPSASIYDINYTNKLPYPGSNVAGSPVALGSWPQNGCYSFLGHCGLAYK